MTEVVSGFPDPLENPGGAVLAIFFNGEYPDGTPLTVDERTRLGSELIEMLTDEGVVKPNKQED